MNIIFHDQQDGACFIANGYGRADGEKQQKNSSNDNFTLYHMSKRFDYCFKILLQVFALAQEPFGFVHFSFC